jgi:putative NADPH-quinone reductase
VRVLILNAHPDEGSLCDAVAAAYVEGARDAGHDIRYIALRELRFDLVLRGGFHSAKPVEPDIAQQQDSIRWCEHLVIVSPNWWWSAPRCLKVTLIASSFQGSRCGTTHGSRMSSRC